MPYECRFAKDDIRKVRPVKCYLNNTSDIFAFGVMMKELITDNPDYNPFERYELNDIKIRNG